MRKKVKELGGMAVLIITLIAVRVINQNNISMKTIINNTREFTDSKGYIMEGNYSISIDLSDLESNEGQELHNDGNNKIYIDSIDNTESISTGGYRIHFRSVGNFSKNHAELVSGVRHATAGEGQFTYDMTAKMSAIFHNKTYKCNAMGVSGVNYRDGDSFSFYIFPREAYENNEISLKETEVVELSISNLYKNVWTKKSCQ